MSDKWKGADSDGEAELLLGCVRAALQQHGAAPTKAPGNGDFDWPRLLDLAGRHGIAPLVHRFLDACGFENSVPADIRQTLVNGYRFNAIRTLSMSAELCRIHRRFQENRIPLAPFKGPVFGEYAYGDACFRPFCDLDFLIHKKDIARAKALLLADGYQPEFNLDAKQEAALLMSSCEYGFHHPRNGHLVELHWNLVPNYASFGFSGDEIWDNLSPLEFFGQQMMAPSPEYMLLILIVHNGGKHQWERLGWILDVAQLIRSCEQLDWGKVIAIASRKGMSRALGLGLYLAHDLLSVKLPGSVLGRFERDPTIKALAASICKRLFTESSPSKFEHLAFSRKLRDRVIDKIRYCCAQLVTSDLEDRRKLNLPRPLAPLYGMVRVARWLGRQRSEIRRQRSEVRDQTSEIRDQRSEDQK